VIGRRIGVALTVAAIGAAGIAATIAANEHEDSSLVLLQESPSLTPIDLGGDGTGHGDMLLFDAPFTTEDGSRGGVLTGVLVVADMPVSTDEDAEIVQSRMTHLVFDFGAGSTIVVAGSAVYPEGEAAEMVAGTPQMRAVIGGTEDFLGARGQIATTRNDDGTYAHELTLLD
jgi:hypothetical protein